jgi:Protein of unknown function (DUF1525)
MVASTMVFPSAPPVTTAARFPRPPLTIDVIAYAPVAFFHCQHCELIWQHTDVTAKARREQLESSLPSDLQEQYQRLSDWVHRMVEVHGEQLHFRIVDAASVEGWLKSVRYGVRRYPAVVVDGKEKSTGADLEGATVLIERRLAAIKRGSA